MKFASSVAALTATIAAVAADPVTYDQYMIGLFEAQLENAQSTQSQIMPMIMGGYEVPVGTRTSRAACAAPRLARTAVVPR